MVGPVVIVIVIVFVFCFCRVPQQVADAGGAAIDDAFAAAFAAAFAGGRVAVTVVAGVTVAGVLVLVGIV